MQHELRAELPDGSVEHHSSTLVEFGREEPGAGGGRLVTAMARTVGLTAAAAAVFLLGGGSSALGGGVFTPTSPAVYGPILAMLQREGIEMRESVRVEAPRHAP